MVAKTKPEIIDQAIILYESGDPLRVCGEKVGVNEETLRNHFKKRGVKMRITSQGQPNPKTITNLPENSICVAYTHGKSENHVANEYGVSRNVIRRILKKHNVHIRTQSEAEELKWSKMTNEQRESQVVKAHTAVRGVPRSDEAKRNLAISREQNTPDWYIGCGEPEFGEWLTNEGIQFDYQKAVEFYNIDFLINGIAVELTSFVGRNRLTRDDFMRRAEILKQQGIKTLAVEFRNAQELINHAYDVLNMVNKFKSGHYGDKHYIAYRLQFSEPDIRILA